MAVREFVRGGLSRLGYLVIDAPDGATALERAAVHDGRIDLLITDVVMPGMTARELAERLLALHPGAKVIYMSGYSDAAVGSGIRERGAVFLQKPFTREVLARRCERCSINDGKSEGAPAHAADDEGRRRSMIREAAVAGSFYAGTRERLRAQVDALRPAVRPCAEAIGGGTPRGVHVFGSRGGGGLRTGCRAGDLGDPRTEPYRVGAKASIMTSGMWRLHSGP